MDGLYIQFFASGAKWKVIENCLHYSKMLEIVIYDIDQSIYRVFTNNRYFNGNQLKALWLSETKVVSCDSSADK